VKHYGTPDEDPTTLNRLLTLVKEEDVLYILHYPRRPMNSKACQWPGSLRVTAILKDNKILSTIQLLDGTFLTERNYNERI
jgi:hypothetical protein